MSALWKGTQFVGYYTMEEFYDPQRGESTRIEWRGEQQAMRALSQRFREVWPQARSSASPIEGPVWRSSLEIPFWLNSTSRNSLQQEWTTSTELVEKDIFEHPVVELALTELDLDDGDRAVFKEGLEEGIRLGWKWSKVATAIGGAPTGGYTEKIYRDLARGITGWETEYQIVTRTRRATIDYPWNRTIFSTRYIYQGDQLGIPGGISLSSGTGFKFVLPTSSQTNMEWGFRLRDQEFRIVGDRQEETVQWALANWSLTLYEKEPTGGSFA